ncbi:MAG: redoxin domain-containing protein [Bacteriovoracaceae bacterium]
MLKKFKDKMVMKLDPVYDTNQIAKTGDRIEGNFKLILSGKRTIDFEEVLANGPLLLVFIKGTWCPFCQIHLKRMRDWSESIKSKVTTIVISSESIEDITKWLKENPSTYLFASDKDG